MGPLHRRHACAAVVAALVVLATRGAAANPVHNGTEITCRNDEGRERRLPPGYHFSEAEREALDASLRSREDDVTRLEAENASLRKSAGRTGSTWAIVVALAVGFAGGAATVILH